MPHRGGYVEIHTLRASLKYRRSEWALACILAFAWGFNLLLDPVDTFANPSFGFLKQMATESEWGRVCAFIGTLRLVVLIVNGRWKKCSHARMFFAGLSFLVWLALALAFYRVGVGSPGTIIYIVFAVTEIHTILEAARDARSADERNAARSA